VNLDYCDASIEERNSVVVTQSISVRPIGPRIERCEFEQLLQRAMEILNARDLKAQLTTTASISAV
jgi:hypothetical protein